MGKGITLALLAAATAALAAALVVGGAGRDEPSSRRLLPDFEPDAVDAITIEARGEPAVRLERAEGALELVEPVPAPADPGAVNDFLGALEMLSYQRRGGAARGLDPPRASISARANDGRVWEIVVGNPVEVSDQVWIGRAADHGLAEGYFARTLLASADDLRERRPFRDVGSDSALSIEAGDAAVEVELGRGRVDLPAGHARADAAAVASLLRDLRGLKIRPAEDAGAVRGDERREPSLRIRVRGDAGTDELAVVGRCEAGELRVSSPLGRGCASRDDLEAIAERAHAPHVLVDRRLVGDAADGIARLSIREGERALILRAGDGGLVSADGAEIESRELRRFLRELNAAAGELREPVGKVRELARLDVEREGDARDAVVIARDAAGVLVAREGEAVGFALAEGAETLVGADLLRFRSRALISREPHAIRELARRAGGREVERVRRGELVGEHEVVHPDGAALRSEAITRAGEAVARLRAAGFDAHEPSSRHDLSPPRFAVEAVFDPPPVAGAEPETYRVAVGADAPGGCYGQLDDGPVAVLPAAACEALAAPLTEVR